MSTSPEASPSREPPASAGGGPTRSPRRRWARRLAVGVAILAAVLLIVVLALAGRLSRGPMSLGFLTDRIEERVDRLIDPLTLELDDVVLAFVDWSQPLSLRIEGLDLFASADARKSSPREPLAAFDDVGVLLSMPVLLRGQLQVVGLELTGARLRAVRSEEGTFELSLAGHRSAASSHPDVSRLIDRFLGPDEGGLRRIRLREGALDVEDRSLDLRWGAEKLELDLERHDSALEVEGGSDLRVGPAITPVTMRATWNLEGRSLDARLALPKLVPNEIGPALREWNGWAALDRPVAVSVTLGTVDGLEPKTASLSLEEEHLKLAASASFEGGLDTFASDLVIAHFEPAVFAGLDDRLSALRSADVSLRGKGSLEVAGRRPRHGELEIGPAESEQDPMPLEAEIDLDWQPASTGPSEADGSEPAQPSTSPSDLRGKVTLTQLEPRLLARLTPELELLAGTTTPLSGHVDFEVAERVPQKVDFALEAGEGVVDLQKIYPQPIRLSGASLRGSVAEGLSAMHVKELEVRVDDLALTATVDALRGDHGYRATAKGRVEGIDLQKVLDFWPPDAGSGARSWVAENLSADGLGPGTIELDATIGRPSSAGESESPAGFSLDRVSATVPFTGLGVQILSPELRVEQIDGSLDLSLERLDFAIDSARLADLAISRGTVAITDLGGEAPLSVDVRIAGAIPSVIETLTREPLSLFDAATLQGIDGQVEGELQVGLPLAVEDGPSADQVDVSARVDLRAVSWSDGPAGLDLEGGQLELVLADRKIEVSGEIETLATRADVTYRQDFDKDGHLEVDVAARVDEKTAAALGLPERHSFGGQAPLQVHYAAKEGGDPTVTVEADLTAVTAEIPEIGWRKTAGVKGALEAEAHLGPAIEIERLRLAAADLLVEGRAELSSDPVSVDVVELPTARWLDSDLHATLRRQSEKNYSLVLGGKKLDLGPTVDYLRERLHSGSLFSDSSPTESQTSVSAPAAPKRPALTLEVALEQLGLPRKVVVESLLTNLQFDGERVEALHLVGELGADGVVQSSLVASGAGYDFVFESSDVSTLVGAFRETSLSGGNVHLSAESRAPGASWSGQVEMKDFVLHEQPLLMRALHLTSLFGLAELFTSDGLQIKDFHADYSLDGRQLEIRDAKAWGPAIYATAQGSFDFSKATMELRGSLAPASTMQRIVGKVPVVRWLLTGRNREGLLATDFTASGPLSKPDVTVNPVSAITPGLARGMVEAIRPKKGSEKGENQQ